jgi:hypothetical protein
MEVYPAATLAARGVGSGPECLDSFASEIRLPCRPTPVSSSHARDAVLCAIAGAEFLAGRRVAPTDLPLAEAEKEGWGVDQGKNQLQHDCSGSN